MSKKSRESSSSNQKFYEYKHPTEQVMTLTDEQKKGYDGSPEQIVHRSLTAIFTGLGLVVDSNRRA